MVRLAMKKYEPVMRGMPQILHGGDYNPEQWRFDRDVWREDMRLARLARINTLTVGIFSWAALEPEEGRFDFSWLDEVMDMLQANGIKAVLATPSGSRPAWLSQKYPEVLRVDAERRRHLHGGRHNHCFTSPVYREKVRRINTLLAERYKDHPAFGLWHVSNEYSGDCHCELCQQAFRKWLKQRYASLDGLNKAWWTAFWSHNYTSWEQIESPSLIGEHELHGLALDWKRFTTEQTVDFLRSEMEPLRRITPGVPCTTNMMEYFAGLDYFRIAQEIDIAAVDSYPAWRGDGTDTETAMKTSFSHDMMRSLKGGRPFMLMESTPSVTNWQPVAKLRRPGTLKLNGLLALAHGSDTVQYFQFRKSRGGYEKFHGAVVDHEGTENTRVFREVAETGETLMKLDEIAGCAKPAQVALIYDVENRWALEEIKGYKQDNRYVETLLEHYAPFWRSGVSVDVIDSTMELAGYKIVLAPMLYMLRPDVAERLKDFVRAGGTLVTTYMTGVADEHDLCFLGGFPGPLKELLGVWCEETDCLYDDEQCRVVWKGKEYLARDFCEIAHLTSAEQLGSYTENFYMGSPAVTVNGYGQGKAYYLAARMGEDFLGDFYGTLMEGLGVAGPLPSRLPEGCTAQARMDGEHDYVFIMNFLPHSTAVDTGSGGIDMLTGETVSGVVELEARSALILKREAK